MVRKSFVGFIIKIYNMFQHLIIQYNIIGNDGNSAIRSNTSSTAVTDSGTASNAFKAAVTDSATASNASKVSVPDSATSSNASKAAVTEVPASNASI